MAEGDDVPAEQLKKLEVTDDDDEVTPGYKAPAKVDVKTLQEMDADDESLVKYKQNLLGQAAETLDEGGSNVLVKALVIKFDDHEPFTLDLTGDLTKLKSNPVTIKEGCSYSLEIQFRVQREIVAGLRFHSATTRKGITVDKSNFMVGSYGPKKEVQSYKTPSEDAPKGMLSRGSYDVKSKFTDDDKNVFLEWEWKFSIKKDW